MSEVTLPAPALPAVAAAAWQAYLAMAASKAAHFATLSTAGSADRRGPRLAQAAQRAARLAEHDACVTRFKEAVRSLGACDPAAQRALLTAIATHAAAALEAAEAAES
ncbi:MAG: hypothetical protein AB7Q81_14910 [Gammaproteobacteria bacterium]